MFDPEWTATYAAQFLRTLYEERGDWSAAAGAYHSLTPEFANIYRARFDKIVAGPRPERRSAPTTRCSPRPRPPSGAAPAPRAARPTARAMAERIRDAGPPPEPVMGSLAGLAAAPARTPAC